MSAAEAASPRAVRGPSPIRAAVCGALLGGCLASGPAGFAAAADWPGLWGPHRNARVAGALPAGPELAVREVWRRPLGQGYSEVAVRGDRAYTLASDGTSDFLVCLDAATGKDVWRARLDATYRGHHGSDDGPISTPLVEGGRVFALSPFGKLAAFEAADGRELWRRDLVAELQAAAPSYGFATSPLLVDGALLVLAGGEAQHNLVALDPATGRTLWSAQPTRKTGYSSPVAVTLAGTPQVVAATGEAYFGFDPRDGRVLWRHPALGEPRQPPVALPGDRLFVTAWNESAVLQVSTEGGAWKAAEVWRAPVLKANYSPAIYHDGHLYGMNGTYLNCLDAATGALRWREKVYNGTLMLVGGDLVLLGERSGDVHVAAASPTGFRRRLQAQVFNRGSRAVTGPVFANGRFYLRNLEEAVALEVVARPAAAAGGGEPRP